MSKGRQQMRSKTEMKTNEHKHQHSAILRQEINQIGNVHQKKQSRKELKQYTQGCLLF